MPRKWGIYGPEKHHKSWRVRIRSPDGKWRSRSFATEADASEYRRAVELELDKDEAQRRAAELFAEAERTLIEAEALEGRTHTVTEALDAYECYLRFEKQNKSTSVTTTVYRLRGLLAGFAETHVGAVTLTLARKAYAARVQLGGSAATHRGELREVRTFWKWLLGKRWVVTNPWAEVVPIGRVRKGKEQLRGHEARKLDAMALRQASGIDVGDDHWAQVRQRGALAVLCALYLGLRAGAVVAMTVRDVADGEVFIPQGKTENARRRIRVPKVLWPLLAARAQQVERSGETRLFPHRREWVRDNTMRLCRAAGVPEICAHSLRGMHATFATQAGMTGDAVAAQLGHSTPRITHAHYTHPDAVAQARQHAVLHHLHGERAGDGQ